MGATMIQIDCPDNCGGAISVRQVGKSIYDCNWCGRAYIVNEYSQFQGLVYGNARVVPSREITIKENDRLEALNIARCDRDDFKKLISIKNQKKPATNVSKLSRKTLLRRKKSREATKKWAKGVLASL